MQAGTLLDPLQLGAPGATALANCAFSPNVLLVPKENPELLYEPLLVVPLTAYPQFWETLSVPLPPQT